MNKNKQTKVEDLSAQIQITLDKAIEGVTAETKAKILTW